MTAVILDESAVGRSVGVISGKVKSIE